mgnify:CR=1 FL=1
MTREVVSVHPETPLREAHEIISRGGFDGVPVVDSENRLVGIWTGRVIRNQLDTPRQC